MKTFPHKVYGEKGKQMETGTKESAALGRMRMFTLQGQHEAQEWSQHPPQALAGNMEYVLDSLIEQYFPEIVKDQISDFSLSVLVKRL